MKDNNVNDYDIYGKERSSNNYNNSMISAKPEVKLEKLSLTNFDIIGYLKDKYEKYENTDLADSSIKINFNLHIRNIVSSRRKNFMFWKVNS